jgi:hypothetical protein
VALPVRDNLRRKNMRMEVDDHGVDDSKATPLLSAAVNFAMIGG